MFGRAAPLLTLGLLGILGGLLSSIVVLQYAGVIPWVLGEGSYIGGPWTGVVVYVFVAGMLFAAGYGWLTIKPWSSMITILAALVAFFIPFVGHMDGTPTFSSAMSPLLISMLMFFMVFRPSTNRAMALALSGQTVSKTPKAPKKAPPPKPMSAARKRELAAEQKAQAASKATTPAAINPVTATSALATASPQGAFDSVPLTATATPGSAVAKSAAAMVMSAAATVKASAASPATPRRSRAATTKPAASTKPATKSVPAPPSKQEVRGLRPDDV